MDVFCVDVFGVGLPDVCVPAAVIRSPEAGVAPAGTLDGVPLGNRRVRKVRVTGFLCPFRFPFRFQENPGVY